MERNDFDDGTHIGKELASITFYLIFKLVLIDEVHILQENRVRQPYFIWNTINILGSNP